MELAKVSTATIQRSRFPSILGPLLLLAALLPTITFADGGYVLNSDQAGLVDAAPTAPSPQPLTLPRPPGSTSEDGEMKVWDTRGPVEVSKHLPSTTSNGYVAGEHNTGVHGLPSGVIVDARPKGGIYPGGAAGDPGR